MNNILKMVACRVVNLIRCCHVGTLGVMVLLAGCGKQEFSQETPEATLASAREMVEQGKAERLHELVYAEDENMRALLARSGRLLGNLETLATTINKKFPKETAAMKVRALEASKQGKATNIVGQLVSSMRGQGGRARQGPPRGKERESFDDAAVALFADPYGFLRDGQDKLTTQPLNDDMVALLWEGKPMLAPIGIAMKQDGAGKWCIMLPTSAPMLSRFLPKSKEQYELFGKLFVVLDKTIVDLNKEVESGRITSLEGVSRRAGEMAFVPAVLVMYAYSKYDSAVKHNSAAGAK